jgi:dihydrofolate synthase/folylpolyglutamate synthase
MNSLNYLLSFQRFGIKLGLDNIARLSERLGNPHLEFPAIHVAGTNGKGSVVAFIHSALVEMGYKVGRFTSPHLLDFSERILLNDAPVSEAEIDELVDAVRPVVGEMEHDSRFGHPTFFEAVTAMALLHFARAKVDFGVIEVGMGGRYDSTNIVRPCVTIINNVSMEHGEFLGDTLEKVAAEKAGIIKPGVEVVSAAREDEVRKVIDARAGECGAKAYYLSSDFHFKSRRGAFPSQWVDYRSPQTTLDDVEINLPGAFQAQNAAVALMSLEILQSKRLIGNDESALRKGMAKASWPARLEKLADSPLIILDSAHNPAAMTASVHSLQELFPGRRVVAVVGMLNDKDAAGSLRTLRKLSETIITTQPDYGRALPAEQLAAVARAFFENTMCEKTIAAALGRALAIAEPEDMVLVIGSLFNVAEVRDFMRNKFPP